MSDFWDEWRGSMDGRVTLWVKRLFRFKSLRVDLHKMISNDDPGCFHTHPALAIRVILRGGYIEELEDGRLRTWRPGMIGIVRPECSHRIARIRNAVSYSLWIRFRKSVPVHLRGDGWRRQQL